MNLPSLTMKDLLQWFKRLQRPESKNLRKELLEMYPRVNSNYPRQASHYITLMAWRKSTENRVDIRV